MSCYDPTKPRVEQRIYGCWAQMKNRCFNEKVEMYPRYGGRGITVCSEWKDDFLAFALWADENGYQDHLTLDRKDNDLDYSPENCRWKDSKQQAQNRSTSKTWMVKGKVYNSCQDAAKDFGVSPATIVHWCNGRNIRGKFHPPKEGCSSGLRYPKVPTI